MKLFTWLHGRQKGCLYHKFCFMNFRIGKWGFDGYILRYPERSVLPGHVDPVSGKMIRINLTLKGDSYFWCERKIFFIRGLLYVFRSDLYRHGLVVSTKTYKLSIGIAKFD